ncbi:hypothetical protein DRO64_11665 [Candidatus Bathyarchaeota archaeon]|nr:MAG: hypothetical protein DRO64_11665 [Candidatus Bathyarchaeota archaeon]
MLFFVLTMFVISSCVLHISAEAFPRLYIKTDKDKYLLGEVVKIHVFLDGSGIRCLCYKHSWLVEVRNAANGTLIKKWEWEALAREKTFMENKLEWLPKKAGTYHIIVRLKEHNQSATKTVRVMELPHNHVTETTTITMIKVTTVTQKITVTKERAIIDITSILYLSILIALLVIAIVESIILLKRL